MPVTQLEVTAELLEDAGELLRKLRADCAGLSNKRPHRPDKTAW